MDVGAATGCDCGSASVSCRSPSGSACCCSCNEKREVSGEGGWSRKGQQGALLLPAGGARARSGAGPGATPAPAAPPDLHVLPQPGR